MRILKNIYLTYWFFIAMAGVGFVFVLAFAFPFLFIIGQFTLVGVIIILLIETILLFRVKNPINANRQVMNPLSLGEENTASITVTNLYGIPVKVMIYDNLPYQLQVRDKAYSHFLMPNQSVTDEFKVEPKERGIFEFGNLYVYASSFLHFVQRKYTVEISENIPVYPSILQMKRMELKVFTRTYTQGIKKIRRLGHNNEFEQIKPYVQGDDIRTINWKATSRINELMVNQYQDERSQSIYSIIDKSRSMRMPFNDLTLLDYAINSTLAFTNIILKKGDRAGLMTFSDKIGNQLAAERKANQLQRIMEILYHQKTKFHEANFELLYQGISQHIKGRSLIMLYTNFDTEYGLKRVLPLLKKINQKHLLVVIFFENTEIAKVAEMQPKDVSEIYLKTFAEKYHMDKKNIAFELKRNNIQTVLTSPENLSVDTINKYLELKARGMI